MKLFKQKFENDSVSVSGIECGCPEMDFGWQRPIVFRHRTKRTEIGLEMDARIHTSEIRVNVN